MMLIPNEVTTRKKWVRSLLERRERIEEVLGVPIGRMLGCGHWGCVFESAGPWVVKFSTDPTEGPIWSILTQLIEEEDYGQGGFPRVKRIVQLLPGLKRGKPLYAIVREDCSPVFVQAEGRAELSSYTVARLSPPEKLLSKVRTRYSQSHEPVTTAAQLTAAFDLHVSSWFRGRQRNAIRKDAGLLDLFASSPQAEETFDTLLGIHLYRTEASESNDLSRQRDKLEAYCYMMRGAIGGPVGESLLMLLSNGVILRDVHEMNIGWRIHQSIEGNEQNRCIVILDPGHTKDDREVAIESRRLEANGARIR